MGGIQLNYISFGPRKIPETPNELREIFTYNDQGEGEYHAPVPVEEAATGELAGLPDEAAASPDVTMEESVEIDLSGSDVHSSTPIEAAAQPVFRSVPVEASRPERQAAPKESLGLPELWRDRRDARNPSSAPIVEERSLATMFRMLGNRTHGNLPASRSSDAGGAEGDEREDLFRRL